MTSTTTTMEGRGGTKRVIEGLDLGRSAGRGLRDAAVVLAALVILGLVAF